MTTISASSTIGIYLVSPSFTNPVVINPGVTISTSGNSVYAFTGAWTIAKKVGSDVPAALDPKFHLPLVQNEVLEPGKWHFVDPADIAQIGSSN